MTIVGLMLSTVGIDKGVGVERFTFGLNDLMDGFIFIGRNGNLSSVKLC